MKISNAQLYATYLRQFESIRGDLDTAVKQLASGKRVQVASDDPTGAGSALRLRARLVRLEGYARTADSARYDLATSERLVGEVHQLLSDAREKATAGASSAADHAALATDVDELRAHLFTLANTSQGGRSLFAGTRVNLSPFDGGGTYIGNTFKIQAPIDTGETVTVNVTGEEVFENGGDFFQILADLSTALQNADTAAVDALVPALNDAMAHVRSVRTDLGMRLRQLDRSVERRNNERVGVQERIAEIENVALERAALDLTAADQSLQALSSSAARVLGRSLFDYLG